MAKDMTMTTSHNQQKKGYFGQFGGRFVPELLVVPKLFG